jgi:hypothetical protein
MALRKPMRRFRKASMSSLPWMSPFAAAAAVTALNVLVASGFSVAGLVRPKSILPAEIEPTAASSIFAMYAAARTLPLAFFAIAAIFLGDAPVLVAFGLLAGVVQLADAAIGAAQRDLGKTIGPLIIAALQFLATYALWRAP